MDKRDGMAQWEQIYLESMKDLFINFIFSLSKLMCLKLGFLLFKTGEMMVIFHAIGE